MISNASSDIWAMPFDRSAKPTPFLTSQYQESSPALSPDGKWLTYSSNETGQNEVYVRSFPGGAGKWQVSTKGGVQPRWRSDSRELFFLDRPQLGSVMSADVDAKGDGFASGDPRVLFKTNLLLFAHPGPPAMWPYDVTPDGQRFIMAVNPRASTFGDPSSLPMVVILNWTAALKK